MLCTVVSEFKSSFLSWKQKMKICSPQTHCPKSHNGHLYIFFFPFFPKIQTSAPDPAHQPWWHRAATLRSPVRGYAQPPCHWLHARAPSLPAASAAPLHLTAVIRGHQRVEHGQVCVGSAPGICTSLYICYIHHTSLKQGERFLSAQASKPQKHLDGESRLAELLRFEAGHWQQTGQTLLPSSPFCRSHQSLLERAYTCTRSMNCEPGMCIARVNAREKGTYDTLHPIPSLRSSYRSPKMASRASSSSVTCELRQLCVVGPVACFFFPFFFLAISDAHLRRPSKLGMLQNLAAT
jgi:hypothetical protein